MPGGAVGAAGTAEGAAAAAGTQSSIVLPDIFNELSKMPLDQLMEHGHQYKLNGQYPEALYCYVKYGVMKLVYSKVGYSKDVQRKLREQGREGREAALTLLLEEKVKMPPGVKFIDSEYVYDSFQWWCCNGSQLKAVLWHALGITEAQLEAADQELCHKLVSSTIRNQDALDQIGRLKNLSLEELEKQIVRFRESKQYSLVVYCRLKAYFSYDDKRQPKAYKHINDIWELLSDFPLLFGHIPNPDDHTRVRWLREFSHGRGILYHVFNIDEAQLRGADFDLFEKLKKPQVEKASVNKTSSPAGSAVAATDDASKDNTLPSSVSSAVAAAITAVSFQITELFKLKNADAQKLLAQGDAYLKNVTPDKPSKDNKFFYGAAFYCYLKGVLINQKDERESIRKCKEKTLNLLSDFEFNALSGGKVIKTKHDSKNYYPSFWREKLAYHGLNLVSKLCTTLGIIEQIFEYQDSVLYKRLAYLSLGPFTNIKIHSQLANGYRCLAVYLIRSKLPFYKKKYLPQAKQFFKQVEIHGDNDSQKQFAKRMCDFISDEENPLERKHITIIEFQDLNSDQFKTVLLNYQSSKDDTTLEKYLKLNYTIDALRSSSTQDPSKSSKLAMLNNMVKQLTTTLKKEVRRLTQGVVKADSDIEMTPKETVTSVVLKRKQPVPQFFRRHGPGQKRKCRRPTTTPRMKNQVVTPKAGGTLFTLNTGRPPRLFQKVTTVTRMDTTLDRVEDTAMANLNT